MSWFEASAVSPARRLVLLAQALNTTPGFWVNLQTAYDLARKLFELLLKSGADLEAPARNPMQVRPIHGAVATRCWARHSS